MSASVQRYGDVPGARRPHRAWWIAAAVIVVIGAAIAIAVPLALRPTPVQVVRRDVIASISLSGQAIAPPSARVDIRVAQPAPVERVDATVGQRVQRGDTLVELYYPSVQQARRQAVAELRTAQQAYAQAQAQYVAQLAAARRRLAQAEEAVRGARRAALAQVPPSPPSPGGGPEENQPAAEGESQPTVYYTALRLVQGPAASSDLQQAQTQQQQAQQDLIQAKTEANQALAPYQQQIDQARAALDAAEAGERASRITAPISGTVTVLNAQPGQTAGANNSVVASIVDLTAVEVQAELSADQASRLRPGTPATVTFTELPNQRFHGRVIHVVTQPAPRGQSPQYAALISFANTRGLAKPAMHARVAILLGQARDVLAVPNSSVRTDSQGHTLVTVKRGDDWVTRHVQTGLRGNSYTEIRSGLSEGDIVQA